MTASGQSVAESVGSASPLNSALKAGIDQISREGQVVFTKYHKVILPLDGFVFWVRADLLSASALQNATALNAFAFNQPLEIITKAAVVVAKGSLHWETTNRQDPDEGFAVNRVVFTSEVEVQDLNEVSPTTMFIASVDEMRFSFSQRQSFYKQAGIYHYVGDAVYPVMETQIIDSVDGFNSRDVVVSNSLPIWLALNRFMPVYPSYLVGDNIPPPYASIHIEPGQQQTLQSIPALTNTGSHEQLVSDGVRVTIFGLRNFNVMDWVDYVLDFIENNDDQMGLMEIGPVRDEKRTQSELSILAQKKTVDFRVSYYQQRIRDIARQLITSAVVDYEVVGFEPEEGGVITAYPATVPRVRFGENLTFAYTGPFSDGEELPAILPIQPVTLTRGVAYSRSGGLGVFKFQTAEGTDVIEVTLTGAGDQYPQVSFVNGPVTLYLNQPLIPVAPDPADPGLTDLTITLGSNPP